MTGTEGMVKIRLYGADPSEVETLWAKPLGGNIYRLENSPFYAYGISFQDIIEAKPGLDGIPEFVRRLQKSGNRTLRVIFENYRSDEELAQSVLSGIRRLGGSYEGMLPRTISITVPSTVNLDDVTDFLSDQSGLQWEYADPTYEEVTRSSAH